MKLKTWIPLGSLVLLLCAQQGESTLILGSMLMAATAAMTGGLIIGPLTVGGLIMMMMMAANQQQQATQRTQAASTTNIASTLENSQNLLNLLSTLTGAASNLATSASTQSNAFANAIQSTATPKASKRALYSPQNLEELLAASSRRTSINRRQWKSLPRPRTTTTTTPSPRQRANSFFDSNQNDFWNSKQPYFSSDSGYAVEPIPDDLLDIAMRLPQAKSENMFGDFDSFDVTSTSRPSSPSTTTEDSDISSTTPFGSFMSDLAPPKPIADELRWVASEPGDLFSSFPQITEEDLMSLIKKRATREALSTKFRLEDIANVTYANDKDPLIKEQLSEREKQEILNTRIYRQLQMLDPFRCLPQLACTLQATPPSQQSGLMNDYAYLLKTVFERDDEDDEADDEKPGASNVKKNANEKKKPSLLSEFSAILSPTSTSAGSRNKNKKVLDYKSPSKTSSNSKSKKDTDDKDDKPESDKNDDDDDDDEDGYSSEEIPMNDEELERLMLKEQYEMEQLANEELLNDDPEVLPYVLKSASKAPPYLGPDVRPTYPSNPHAAVVIDDGATGVTGSGSSTLGGRFPIRGREDVGRGPSAMYAQPPPLFNPSRLRRYKPEDLDKMSSSELNSLLKQVSHPGEDFRMDDTTFHDDDSKLGVGNIISTLMPKMPDLSFGFSARRRTTGNTAFDDDPFFDDFRRRSLEPFAMQKLRKVKRVVRRVRMEGPPGKLAYVRRMKRQIDSKQTDPAELFRIAQEAGKKFKSARQCRFLFSSCPMNSTQLLSMIGNIRNAVINLSSAQQLLNNNQAATTQAPAKDIVQTLATIGPNVVTTTTSTPAPPPPPPPPPQQLPPFAHASHHHLGMHIQPVLPLSPMMPQSPQSSNQNTLVVPQIIQVPMPFQTQQASAPAPQPIIVQQPAPQMIMAPQQQRDPPQHHMSRPNNNIFNIGSSSGSSEGSDGTTSISHELPTGEKLEISMKLSGQQGQPSMVSIPLKTKKKTAYPSESPRPTVLLPASASSALSPASSLPKSPPPPKKKKNPAGDLVDLFDDDNTDNFLLPSKTLIETEIKEPSTSIDSLQAAILAIEKINQAANDRRKVTTYGEDDEKEDYPVNQKLIASLQKPIVAVPITRKPVPSGMRLPSRKKNKNKNYSKINEKPSDDEDESESDEDDEEEDDVDEDGYKRRLSDPMDPKRRDYLPVPTKSAQFSSTMSVPATQTFVKRRLQVDNDKDSSEESLSNREMTLEKRLGKVSSSSEEDDDEPRHHNPNRRKFTISTTSRSKVQRVRKPKILYPQQDLDEKPVFIPLWPQYLNDNNNEYSKFTTVITGENNAYGSSLQLKIVIYQTFLPLDRLTAEKRRSLGLPPPTPSLLAKQFQYFQESIIPSSSSHSTFSNSNGQRTNSTVINKYFGGGLSGLEKSMTEGGVIGPREKQMIKERREQRRRQRLLQMQQRSRLNRPSARSREIMKRTLEIANERV